jgi:glutamate dehydrogenase (NAD(P)+)
VRDKTVVVQGFGNVGYHSAKFLRDAGAKVVAIAEYNGAIFDSNGLDIDALHAHFTEKRTFEGFAGATTMDSGDALELECDVLIPAAAEQAIHKDNAPRVKAKVIGEAANGPITVMAAKILDDKGTIVIPDLLLNAGGVTVSYFEWLKNLSHVRFGRLTKQWEENTKKMMMQQIMDLKPTNRDPRGPPYGETSAIRDTKEISEIIRGATEKDIVHSGLEDTMVTAVKQTVATAQRKGVTLRIAAYVNALEKIKSSYDVAGVTL